MLRIHATHTRTTHLRAYFLQNTPSNLCVTWVQSRQPLELQSCASVPSSNQHWSWNESTGLILDHADACLDIRENQNADPGVLYASAPCRNTSNEWWDYNSTRIISKCNQGTCEQWEHWCLTAQRGHHPTPPIPPAPLAPLQAKEIYRTRVHTAGRFCCPGGADYCNATDSMRDRRCSGYYGATMSRLVE